MQEKLDKKQLVTKQSTAAAGQQKNTSVSYQGAEIRWFAESKNYLKSIFDNIPDEGIDSEVEERTDYYKILGNTSIGEKIRENQYEIKKQTQQPDIKNYGQIEYWTKESKPNEDDIYTQILTGKQEDWIAISKKRWKKKFKISGEDCTPVKLDEMLDEGCTVEFTVITFPNEEDRKSNPLVYYSLAIEAFATKNTLKENILASIERLNINDAIQKDKKEFDNCKSHGYPHFINDVLKSNRKYKTSKLPLFNKEVDMETRQFVSQKLYAEVNTNYRHLADLRFKLLGLVPAVSILAWIQILKYLPPIHEEKYILNNIFSAIATAVAGLLIVCGIRIYDKRNDELYDDLVSRGRKIEDYWGIHTGVFKGRRSSSNKILNIIPINHGTGLGTIYWTVMVGWVVVIMYYLRCLL